MKIRLIGLSSLLLLASVVSPPCAWAASFDCGRARTEVEKAICGDAAMGRLDVAISREYRSLMSKVEPRYQAKLAEVQKTWLKHRSQVEGLQDALRKRLHNLQNAVVTLNGVTLLRLDGPYLPPYVLTPLPGAAAYNRMVDGVLADARSDRIHDAAMAECNALQDAESAGSHTPGVAKKLEDCESLVSTSRYYTVDFVSPDLLSVEEGLTEGAWGAAHPSNSDRHMNWWLSKPGTVRPTDIFSSTAYRRVLATSRHRQMEMAGNIVESDSTPDNTVDEDTDRWGLTSDHLRITGQGYEYGIGRGYVEIEVPWRDFGDSVRPAFFNLLKKGGRVTDSRLRLPSEQ